MSSTSGSKENQNTFIIIQSSSDGYEYLGSAYYTRPLEEIKNIDLTNLRFEDQEFYHLIQDKILLKKFYHDFSIDLPQELSHSVISEENIDELKNRIQYIE